MRGHRLGWDVVAVLDGDGPARKHSYLHAIIDGIPKKKSKKKSEMRTQTHIPKRRPSLHVQAAASGHDETTSKRQSSPSSPQASSTDATEMSDDDCAADEGLQVEHQRTPAKPGAPHPPQESGNWLDDAPAFVQEGSTAIVHNAEALWKAPPREMKTAKKNFREDSTSYLSSRHPQSRCMRGTACAFSDVIAAMDVPFDSPALVALPAAAAPLQGDAGARTRAVEQQSSPRLLANSHGSTDEDDEWWSAVWPKPAVCECTDETGAEVLEDTAAPYQPSEGDQLDYLLLC